ncbi:hypothetical protein KEH51_23445 [[Brevibacterium] frigoritolerans]|uniref:Uncharacterized protein n=1 Tax=Peribacillus frigoritolerans TaxID=450367 RepID=A0A941FTJ9_9BACI|nr:hypothetical protein [Peribacillus frigoritolerans]
MLINSHNSQKDTLKTLSEVLKLVDYLLGHWEILDGEGLTDEQVNRALHFIIDGLSGHMANRMQSRV